MAIKSVTAENLAESAISKMLEVPTVVEAQKTEEVAEPKKEAPKNSVQERINELTREKKELEEFAEGEYEARLQAQRRIAELETQIKPIEEPKDQRPDRAKFTDADQYENELLAWNRREAKREFVAEENQRRLNEALSLKVEQARKDLPDFDQVIQAAERRNEKVPAHITAAIHESDNSGHLAYFLAKPENKAQVAKILALRPAAALLALGKIELTLVKAEKPSITTPVITRAPAPMQSLNGSGEIPKDLAIPMAFKDYKRERIEQNRSRRR